uniref:Uncharacterized protein n=1 Tax=Arundo donax TaxID=35708 RepID=A0A0A8ZGG3_ARUDO
MFLVMFKLECNRSWIGIQTELWLEKKGMMVKINRNCVLGDRSLCCFGWMPLPQHNDL